MDPIPGGSYSIYGSRLLGGGELGGYSEVVTILSEGIIIHIVIALD